MSAQIITVLARITAREGQGNALAIVLQKLVAPTCREPGCISYRLMQNAENPCDFNTIEQWRDATAIDAHMQSPHVQAAITQAMPLLAAVPDIRQYSVIA